MSIYKGRHLLNAYSVPKEPFAYFLWCVVIIAEQVPNIVTVTKQRLRACV